MLRSPSQVHVLHVVRTLGLGGMEQNLRRVAVKLEARGIRHSILLLHDHRDTLEFPTSIPIHRIVPRRHDPRLPITIGRLLRTLAPSVIHVRNPGAWPDTALARLLFTPRVPFIFSFHGMESSSVSTRTRVAFPLFARLTTRLFTVSFAARELLVERHGLPRSRVDVILNGVDVARFAPPEVTQCRERPIIGAVGRLFRVKNFSLLLRAARILIDRGLAFELRIAGGGPEAENLAKEVETLRLGAHVRLVGHVEDVPGFLREIDLFALSSDSEANPNALLEAMATGLACVSTAVGGVREVLGGGAYGLLVPPRDPESMAEALQRLIQDSALRRALGASARAHVVSEHGEARMLDRYEALYRDPRHADLA